MKMYRGCGLEGSQAWNLLSPWSWVALPSQAWLIKSSAMGDELNPQPPPPSGGVGDGTQSSNPLTLVSLVTSPILKFSRGHPPTPAHREWPHENKRHAYRLGKSKEVRSYGLGTGDKDQIHTYIYI